MERQNKLAIRGKKLGTSTLQTDQENNLNSKASEFSCQLRTSTRTLH